jgi:hypothetical protein
MPPCLQGGTAATAAGNRPKTGQVSAQGGLVVEQAWRYPVKSMGGGFGVERAFVAML